MLPLYVVLDTKGVLRLFRNHVREFKKPPELVDDLLQELVQCYKHRGRIETRVDDMVAAMLNHDFEYDFTEHSEHDYNLYVDAGVISFVLQIDDNVRAQLKDPALCDSHGALLYEYYPMTKEGFTDIVLKLRRTDAHFAPVHPVRYY